MCVSHNQFMLLIFIFIYLFIYLFLKDYYALLAINIAILIM
jgi:hypothetical protein